MKFTIPKDHLLPALGLLKPIAGKSGTLPILSCVRIFADAGKIFLCACDIDQGLRLELPAEVQQPGALWCVSLSKLLAAVQKIEGSELNLRTAKNGRLELSCGNYWVSFYTLPSEEFPVQPARPEREGVEVNANFAFLLNRAGAYVSSDDSRYVLNGVCFDAENEKLALVATDGRRLFRCITEYTALSMPIIVPIWAVTRLSELATGGAWIDCTESTFFAHGAGWAYSAKLIEGNFPGYRQILDVLPEKPKHELTIPRYQFAKALPFVQTMISAKAYPGVKLDLDAEGGFLDVTSQTPDVGETRVRIPVETKGPRDFKAMYNADFLASIVATIRAENVVLQSDGPNDPVLIQDENAQAVLMPMRRE